MEVKRAVKELIELRIHEQHASMLLRPDEGRSLMGLVRQVFLPSDDPRLGRIGELDRQLGHGLFSSWRIRRRYTSNELRDAKLLQLKVTSAFEPAGEECGTEYDPKASCPLCGAGRTRTELRLDVRRAPASADIACTIARDEIIVSDRLARVLKDKGLSGFEFRPIATPLRSKPRKQEASATPWYELVVTSTPVTLSVRTRAGESPFDDNSASYACPLGDTVGLNLLSEVYVDKASVPDADMMMTRQFVGVRRGLLVPAAPLLISQHLFEVLRDSQVRGFEVEVAHVV
jgi:hypothetical protein